MKFTRTASTNWKGTGMEGKGSVTYTKHRAKQYPAFF
jgi:hypothetical protein